MPSFWRLCHGTGSERSKLHLRAHELKWLSGRLAFERDSRNAIRDSTSGASQSSSCSGLLFFFSGKLSSCDARVSVEYECANDFMCYETPRGTKLCLCPHHLPLVISTSRASITDHRCDLGKYANAKRTPHIENRNEESFFEKGYGQL